MAINQITDNELRGKRMSELSNRPTDPLRMGGDGLTAREFRDYQDRYPELVKNKLNELIEALGANPGASEDAFADIIKIGAEIAGGEVQTLSQAVASIRAYLNDLNTRKLEESDLRPLTNLIWNEIYDG